MSNHTPGPWEVAGTSIVTETKCIAVIEDDGGSEAPSGERKANARLIAASPDLLAACKATVEMFDAMMSMFGELEAKDGSVRHKLVTAIAKAESGAA